MGLLTGGYSMGCKAKVKTSMKEVKKYMLSVCKGDGHSWIPATNEPGKPNIT